MKALASKPSDIRLQRRNYRIVPLNPSVDAPISELAVAIDQGVSARPDLSRLDFYEVDLEDGWAYVHLHDDARVAYLVAYSGSS